MDMIDELYAFPFKADTNDGPVTHPGMTLRDWFAGMALQGSLASNSEGYEFSSVESAAKWAYQQADAMLKARGDA